MLKTRSVLIPTIAKYKDELEYLCLNDKRL